MSHPHLVYPARLHIYPVAHPVSPLLRLSVGGEGDCQGAAEDQVCCQAGVRVRGIVCVPAIGPGEDMSKAPRADEGLGFRAGAHCKNEGCGCLIQDVGETVGYY